MIFLKPSLLFALTYLLNVSPQKYMVPIKQPGQNFAWDFHFSDPLSDWDIEEVLHLLGVIDLFLQSTTSDRRIQTCNFNALLAHKRDFITRQRDGPALIRSFYVSIYLFFVFIMRTSVPRLYFTCFYLYNFLLLLKKITFLLTMKKKVMSPHRISVNNFFTSIQESHT